MTGRRLLAVFAHPDDETFGAGGTLALYARRGVEVHLVCATRGEVGEAPPDLKGFPTVGAMRESELRCAAEILGLKGVYFLGYRDSGMPGSPDNTHPQAFAAAPLEETARATARFIRAASAAGGSHLRSDRRLPASGPHRRPPRDRRGIPPRGRPGVGPRGY